MTASLTVLGHATVVIDVAGQRFITDPILRDRIGYLRRVTAPVAAHAVQGIDAVLISHVHHDHLDGPSLRRLGTQVPVIAPSGARRLLHAKGMRSVRELRVGDELAIGRTRVVAVPAEHGATRLPGGRQIPPLGYVLEAGLRLYFAGDTDRFAGMAAIGQRKLDVAVVPVSGWGGRLPAGHLNPSTAADALRLLRPRIAVPIHWGTLQPAWWRPRAAASRREPAMRFAEEAARRAPEVEVCILDDGETLRLT